MNVNILIIEDEKSIRDMLRFSLANEAFDLVEAENVKQAKLCLGKSLPDIILLDWMLPEQSGLDFIAWLKLQDNLNTIPIIMLTAKAEEENKVMGLTKGADDYITKPFSPKELIARIKAVLRRSSSVVTPDSKIIFKELVLNTEKNQLSINKQAIPLTLIEYKLLKHFMRNPNKICTRENLITKVWGINTYIDERTVDATLKRLRSKLKPFGYNNIIKTVRGVGYQFDRDL